MEAATSRSKKISVSIKDFNEAIITAMKGRNPIDLPELISAIELSTGLSGVSVRQRLLSTEALEIASVKGRRCKSVYCRSEEHTSELQSRPHLVCRLLLEKKKS